MKTGWVYIIINDSMPGLIKIGHTSGTPQERAVEICGTGVPTPFMVATAFLFADNARNIEQLSHSILSHLRASASREFFKCSAEEASYAIIRAADQLNEQILKNTPTLLSNEEINNNKRRLKQEEDRLKELSKPCRRLHWTQAYSPYLDAQHRDQSKFGHKPYVYHWHGKASTIILHNFSDCDCASCKKNNIFLFKNPRDPNSTPGMWWNESQYELFNPTEKYYFMERARLCVHEEIYLSKDKLDVVNYQHGLIWYGVIWDCFEGKWTSTTRGFILRIRQEKSFNCKIEAINHFKSNHYEDKPSPSEVSRLMCPCERCKESYLQEQARTNLLKNQKIR